MIVLTDEILKDINLTESEAFNDLSADPNMMTSLMPEAEREIIYKTIKYCKPLNILELGVAMGAGSLLILDAIKDMPNARLTSVDIEKQYVNDRQYEVGYAAIHSSRVNHDQWRLFCGHDVSEVLNSEECCGKYDFVVIDTAHIHPIESLNFLTILPFLDENAVVFVQDISLQSMCLHLHGFWHVPMSEGAMVRHASKLLFDTVVGYKWKLPIDKYSQSDKNKWNIEYSNLGLLQVNNDTWKYLDAIFSMLEYPWGIMPSDIGYITTILKKNYEEYQYSNFRRTLLKNVKLIFHKGLTYRTNMSEIDWSSYKNIIFYGCGHTLRKYMESKNIQVLPDYIWDVNATNICLKGDMDYLMGYAVEKPNSEMDKKSTCVIIMMDSNVNGESIQNVTDSLNSQGFEEVFTVDDLDF